MFENILEVLKFVCFFADSSKIVILQLLSDILREDSVVCQSLFGFIDHSCENVRCKLASMVSFFSCARGIVLFTNSFMFSSYMSLQASLAFAPFVTVLTLDAVLLDLLILRVTRQ